MGAKKKVNEFTFEPIPGIEHGYTALTIRGPGSFFTADRNDYAVFVGGGGVGHRKTLPKAKALLLDYAKTYCRRRIGEAQRETRHYKAELRKLEEQGLRKRKE